MDPLIITAAIVGGELTKKDTPHLPTSSQEIADEAISACKKGASIIHLHARDEKGAPSHDPKFFSEIIEAIKQKSSDLKITPPICQFSTGGSIGMCIEERMAPLDLNPEMATLTTGTTNFGKDVFENTFDTIERIAQEMLRRKIEIEIEIFDVGMLDQALQMIEKGQIKKPFHVNFVLGVPGALSAEPENLFFLRRRLPQGISWSVAGVGRHQLPLALLAIGLGGHVRVGLEDNIYLRKEEFAKGNAPLVERVKRLSMLAERPVATPLEARKILNISGKAEVISHG